MSNEHNSKARVDWALTQLINAVVDPSGIGSKRGNRMIAAG